jgi:carboxylesterase type B
LISVEWTRQNIVQFGGVAERMIIWGQSAGSMAVDFYNFAWPSDPIVKGLAMDSGTAHLDLLKSVDTTHSNFSFAASNIGCANQTDSATELACMRSLPANSIENFLHSYQDAGTAPPISFTPIADEIIVFGNYTEKALNGEMSDLVRSSQFQAVCPNTDGCVSSACIDRFQRG